MAQFEQHFVQDLTQQIKVRHCGSIVFNADNESNVVSVRLFNGSEPVAISGSVVGAVVCSDGSTVPLAGSYSGNTASITLTGDCFAVLGQIGVGIQIVNGTQKTTVLKAIYNVETLTTSNVVDPGSRITLNVSDLIDDIETAVASIPADYSDLLAAIAPNYSGLTFPVKAGTFCWYDGTLYQAQQDIATSEAWTAAHWASSVLTTSLDEKLADVDDELGDLKSAVTPVGVIEYTTVDGYVNAQGGISPDGTAANGTKSTNRILCQPGDVFRFSISFSETKNEWIAYAFYSNIGAFISRTVPYNMVDGTKFEFTVTIPDNAYYILFSYRTFTTSSAIIDRYTPILGRIEAAESTIEEIEIAQTTKAFIESHTPYTSKSTLQKDGGIYTNQGYGANLAVSDYLLVSALNGYMIKNALSWTAANGYSVAFYTADKTAIGNASAASSSDKTNYSADISALAESYTGAVYMRVAFDTNDAFEIEPNHVSSDVYPPYNVNAYPHMVCCGDSVTAGFVVEGTASNPQTIYEVMDDYSYPAVLGRTYGVTVAKYAQSGISVNGFYTTIYPNIDFTDYDLAIFELGLNPGSEGYLNISDWDTAGTSTYIYRQMIAAVRAQNADIKIVLMRSQIYQNDALAVLQAIANESDCYVIDLMNTKYINLNDTKYHGYYSNSGTAALDPTHFNRIGYTAKAYDVVRWLGELLP